MFLALLGFIMELGIPGIKVKTNSEFKNMSKRFRMPISQKLYLISFLNLTTTVVNLKNNFNKTICSKRRSRTAIFFRRGGGKTIDWSYNN